MSPGPAYHARTHAPGGTDPIPGGGHGPWLELELINGFTGGPLEYRHAPGSPGADQWELEWRGHIEGPTGTHCGVLPAEDCPPSDKYGITEGENDDGDGIVVEWYIESDTGYVFITFPVGSGGGGVDSIAKSGDTPLTGDVTLSEGSNITLTQSGNDIEIAASGGGSGLWTLISDTTLGVDTASFDITSISGSYKHLRLILDARGTTGASSVTVYCRFNNDSGSNYDYEWLYANSATPAALEGRGQAQIFLGDITASTAASGRSGLIDAVIPNYAGTTFDKNIRGHAGMPRDTTAGNIFIETTYGCWRSTSAITRVTLLPSAGNFLTASRLSLYGIS